MAMKIEDVVTGMILARDDLEFPAGALQVTRDNPKQASPMGGGFVYKLDRLFKKYGFHEATEAEKESKWKPAKFMIDDEPVFSGFSDGQAWNGWACPEFLLDQAKLVALWAKDEDGEPGKFDEANDCFVFKGCDDEEYRFGSSVIRVNGQDVKVYGIGAMCWTWDEVKLCGHGQLPWKCENFDRDEADECDLKEDPNR